MKHIKITAKIQGAEYPALISADGKSISVYNVVSSEDGDFLGIFRLDEHDNIIQDYPMSDTSSIIGKVNRLPL
ncbi:hypothetical protein KA005_26845 [bacterium]|nr:hypothetical protein [bacterium]